MSRGFSAETRAMSRFRSRGWLVKPSRASRGPYDFYAMRGGRKMFVQVKSGHSPFSSRDRLRLRSVARQRGGSAMLYRMNRRRIRPQFV
jgi:hypothetical protein